GPVQAADGASEPSIAYRLTPLLALLTVYWAFALASHLNIGHRHLLPTYPALFIIAGAAARWFEPVLEQPKGAGKSKISLPAAPSSPMLVRSIRLVVSAALLLLAVEAFGFWPNYLAYFNPLDGGPRHAYRHLNDSSLDWSQDLKGVKSWLDAH